MNFLHKDEWVEALRSKEFPQTMGALRDDQGFCCLGVYHHKFIKELPPRLTVSEEVHSSAPLYKNLNEVIPKKLLDMAIEMNDTGSTFEEIADMIENEDWNKNPFFDTPAFSNQPTQMKG